MKSNRNSLSVPLAGLKFKGNRNYLHGTDILEAGLRVIATRYNTDAIADIDISFHKRAETGLTLYSVPPLNKEPTIQLSCKIAGAREKFFLVEDSQEISERYDYAEEAIVAATQIRLDCAFALSNVALPFTDIERWVAMVKALHHGLYPEASGKWLFVRGKFVRYHGTYGHTAIEHRVRVEANFNNKFTRSALLVGGEKLGDIFFSLD
jgi:hypothetical protein